MINKLFRYCRKKLLNIIFIFCIIIVCFALIRFYSNKIVFSNVDRYENINIESIMDTCDKYDMAIYYPSTQNNKVNLKVKDLIDTYIYRLKKDAENITPQNNDQKLDLVIEYEINRVNEYIVSFSFVINYNNRKNSILDYRVETKTYNLKSGNELTLNDFFDKNKPYVEFLCDQSKDYFLKSGKFSENDIKMIFENIDTMKIKSFDGYSFSNTHFSIFYDMKKINPLFVDIYEIKIPWENLQNYVNKNIYIKEFYEDVAIAASANYNGSENDVYFPAFNINISSDDKIVALTFDDGPHHVYTDKLLKHMGKKNVVATFFVLGTRIEYNKELLRRMVDLGCEIGNHSMSHKLLTKTSDAEVANQIESVNSAIKSITGFSIRAVRPPYGSSNIKVKQIINKPIVLWNVDPQDWKYRDAATVRDHVLSKVQSGSIILLHDIYESSVDAAIMIIDELLAQGYKFVTVSQMLNLEDEGTNGVVFTNQK